MCKLPSWNTLNLKKEKKKENGDTLNVSDWEDNKQDERNLVLFKVSRESDSLI